jgi:hypothetical protein
MVNSRVNKKFGGKDMDLCGEFLTHKVFGRGKILGIENGCVTVLFLESNERKKFIYPNAFGRFLVLENEKLVKQLQDYENEIAHSIAAAQRESEANRSFEKIQKVNTAKKPPRKSKQNKVAKKEQ